MYRLQNTFSLSQYPNNKRKPAKNFGSHRAQTGATAGRILPFTLITLS